MAYWFPESSETPYNAFSRSGDEPSENGTQGDSRHETSELERVNQYKSPAYLPFDVFFPSTERHATGGLEEGRAWSENPAIERHERRDENIKQIIEDQELKFLVEGRYVIEHYQLGRGAFGTVYAGYDSLTNMPLAIKVDTSRKGLLSTEGIVYNAVRNRFPGLRGFPKIYYQGDFCNNELLVMERLGKSIAEHLVERHGRFSLKTTLMIGLQMVERLEHLHESDMLHCDVKPDNMMMGFGGEASTLYLVDMGLSRPFRPPQVQLTRETSNTVMTGVPGTLLFAAAEFFSAKEMTRRDDLESLGYTMLFLMHGDLPWQNLAYSFMNAAEVGQSKLTYLKSEEFQRLPRVLREFFEILRVTKPDEKPCYRMLRAVLQNGLEEMGEREDGLYDWNVAEMNQLVEQSEDVEMTDVGKGPLFHAHLKSLMSAMDESCSTNSIALAMEEDSLDISPMQID